MNKNNILLIILILTTKVASAQIAEFSGENWNFSTSTKKFTFKFNDIVDLNEATQAESITATDTTTGNQWVLRYEDKSQKLCHMQIPCLQLTNIEQHPGFLIESHIHFQPTDKSVINGIYFEFTYRSALDTSTTEEVEIIGNKVPPLGCDIQIIGELQNFYDFYMYGLNRGLNSGYPYNLRVECGLAWEYQDAGNDAYNITLLQEGAPVGVMRIIFLKL